MGRGKHTRSNFFWLACVLLMIVYPSRAQRSTDLIAPDIDVIRVDTTLITVNVSVTDAKKQHVPSLRVEDFRVTDQGKIVRPEFFDAQGPESIIFVVDVSASMKGERWQNLRAGLRRFLAKEREGSDYTLIAFNERPRLNVSSANAQQLWESFNSLQPSGDTALYDALLLGLRIIEHARQRHKAVVLLSDGEDNCSRASLALVEQLAPAIVMRLHPMKP
jgi:Ca-activated chloride channel homolog